MSEANVVHFFVGGAKRGEWKEAHLVPAWLSGAPDLETLLKQVRKQGYYAQLGVRGKLPTGNPLTLRNTFSI